jgi:hypothetical protein
LFISKVPDHVVRAVKVFNPRLTIMFNPNWEKTNFDPEWRFIIAQEYTRVTAPTNAGLVVVFKDQFPVLGMPDAMSVDRRWFSTLDGSRWINMVNIGERMNQRRLKQRHDMANNMRDYAKDQGWYYYKRYLEAVRGGTYDHHFDPTRERKTLEDKLGREPL